MKGLLNANNLKLFLDIDNTLAVFSHGKEDDARALEASNYPGFYLTLKPMPYIWVYWLVNLFFPVYIVSAYPNTLYAKEEKIAWIHKYMPFIKDEHIILVPNGTNKADFVASALGIEIDRTCILLDDYGVNLHNWGVRGGTPVKKSMNPEKKREGFVVINHYEIFKVLSKAA